MTESLLGCGCSCTTSRCLPAWLRGYGRVDHHRRLRLILDRNLLGDCGAGDGLLWPAVPDDGRWRDAVGRRDLESPAFTVIVEVAQEEEVVGVGVGFILGAQVVGDGAASGHSSRRGGSAKVRGRSSLPW